MSTTTNSHAKTIAIIAASGIIVGLSACGGSQPAPGGPAPGGTVEASAQGHEKNGCNGAPGEKHGCNSANEAKPAEEHKAAPQP